MSYPNKIVVVSGGARMINLSGDTFEGARNAIPLGGKLMRRLLTTLAKFKAV